MADKEPMIGLFDKEATDIVRKAIFKKGMEHQKQKCIEEMEELTTALMHYKDGKATFQDVCSEIADVMITARQMQLIFGEKEVEKEINNKLVRLQMRMEGDL